MKRIMLATNATGYQIDKCFDFSFFKEPINIVISDRACPALDVAKKHRIAYIDLAEKDSIILNSKILNLAIERDIDYIISPGFTRVFRGELLERYHNRMFNCHPSILPAFKGFYDTRDIKRKHHARKIFERVIDFGSRVTGNTIHSIAEGVDDGYPIIVSIMNIPYGEDVKFTRHRLFLQECKSLLQLVSWLNQDRLAFDDNGLPFIKDAKYDAPFFSPNLEDPQVCDFDLPYPYQLNDEILSQSSS